MQFKSFFEVVKLGREIAVLCKMTTAEHCKTNVGDNNLRN